MITPRFEIQQSDTDITFIIHAPYASIADAEIHADLDVFCFYASPYYLRLHLPGHIEETEASKGSYDADLGTFIICVQKVKKGEHFPDLDLITSLLTARQQHKQDIAQPKIEVVGETSAEYSEIEDHDDFDCEGDEWYIEQKPFAEPTEEFLISASRYGFGNQISGAFHNFKTEFLEIVELLDPDRTPALERRVLRIEHETQAFSDDHYLADWAQPDVIESILLYRAVWDEPLVSEKEVLPTDQEKDVMKDLPKKEFLLDKSEECIVGLSLVDILYGYAYNVRTTLGENTVESAWTINKLSATLTWFENFCSVQEVVTACLRRSLCYPLYRHWDLSVKVLHDVKNILKLGKRQVLKCLLDIYCMFSNSEPRYLLNQLYIRDYCIWIQQVPGCRIESLYSALCKIQPEKSLVKFDLEELETAARLVQEEEASPEVLTNQVANLKLVENCGKLRKDSQGSSSSSDSDSSSEDSASSSSSELDSDDLSDSDS